MSACILPMKDVVCAPIIPCVEWTRLPFDCGNLFFFCIYICNRTGKQRIANFYFTKRMKCGTMKRSKRKKKSWPLEYFRREKKSNKKKKFVEQKSEVSEHFVDFLLERLFSVSMLFGSLVHVHRKTFVNSITLVTCLVDFV